MWPQFIRVIQDPVYGLMQFRRSESLVVDLLSCKELQRLRRIRQLGLANFVFPGAEHSRFVHSVGAAFLAARIGRHLESIANDLLPEPLRPDRYAIRDFCVAALCHDLGHGPFSHVWERVVIGENWNRIEWAKALGINEEESVVKDGKWHELVTHALLNWSDGQLHKLLEANESGSARRVSELLTGKYYLHYLCRLLNSDVDIDRCDFLQRDGLMAGLPFGRFQLDRLITCLTFGFDGENRCNVGLDLSKGLHTALELLKGRSDLYEVLYFHKTVIGMEWLLALLLERLKDLSVDGAFELRNNPIIEPITQMLQSKSVSPDKILQVDDYSIWVLVWQIDQDPRIVRNDVTATNLARRLVERDPLRSVQVHSDRIEKFIKEGKDAYSKVEKAVSKYVAGEPKYYYKFDHLEYPILEEGNAQQSFLVDTEEKGRRTVKLKDHPLIRASFHRDKIAMGWRLLVPREDREEVTKLVQG